LKLVDTLTFAPLKETPLVMDNVLSTTIAGAFMGVLRAVLLPVKLIWEKETEAQSSTLSNKVIGFLIRML
jgi:hypothetical protein